MNDRLDVAFLIEDPEFMQLVAVIRREEIVNDKGRGESALKVFQDIQSVVIPVDTAIGGNTIELVPDEQHRNSNLIVYTKFRLRSVSQQEGANYLADLVMWAGDPYKVTLINDYSAYGEGFIKAECSSINPMDEAPGLLDEIAHALAAEPEEPADG